MYQFLFRFSFRNYQNDHSVLLQITYSEKHRQQNEFMGKHTKFGIEGFYVYNYIHTLTNMLIHVQFYTSLFVLYVDKAKVKRKKTCDEDSRFCCIHRYNGTVAHSKIQLVSFSERRQHRFHFMKEFGISFEKPKEPALLKYLHSLHQRFTCRSRGQLPALVDIRAHCQCVNQFKVDGHGFNAHPNILREALVSGRHIVPYNVISGIDDVAALAIQEDAGVANNGTTVVDGHAVGLVSLSDILECGLEDDAVIGNI